MNFNLGLKSKKREIVPFTYSPEFFVTMGYYISANVSSIFRVYWDYLGTEDKISLEFPLGLVHIPILFELDMMDNLFPD